TTCPLLVRGHPPREQVEDRDATFPRRALSVLLALDRIPAARDVDHPLGEVHVLPAERLHLPTPQSGIERARPQSTLAVGHRRDQRARLGGGGDAVPATV